MKSVIFLLVSGVFSAEVFSQSLTVSTSPSDTEVLEAAVTNGKLMLSGQIGLADYSYSPSSDPSLKAFTLPDGSVILRENIANFVTYDSFGSIESSVSNSTQSEGGEAISELSMDASGKTIVVYNPKVNQGGQTGSRAKILNGSPSALDVFYSSDRTLTVVEVSSNGEFIAFSSVKDGTDDEVKLMDRFGNELNTISFDQSVEGVTFSENGLFVAIYSGGRVAAYEVRSGERVGSTSFRNTSVQFAAYDPADETIIALTGSGDATITEIEIHAVSVAKRQIARENLSGSLTKAYPPAFERTGSGQYRISGYDKDIQMRARF